MGIGTTAPGAKLDITGTSDQAQLAVRGFTGQTSDLLDFYVSGTKRVYFDSTGALNSAYNDGGKYILNDSGSGLNYIKSATGGARLSVLGIGTDPNASHVLTGNSTINSSGVVWGVIMTTTNTCSGSCGSSGVGGFYSIRTFNSAQTALNAYGLQVAPLTVSGGGAVTNNYGVYIDPGVSGGSNFGVYQVGSAVNNYFAGNVGIGSTTPEQKLEVAGNILASASGNVDLILNSTTSDDTKFTLRSTGASDRFEILGSASQNYLTILKGGNVGIGTTSPAAKLHVNTPENATLRVGDDSGAWIQLQGGGNGRDITGNFTVSIFGSSGLNVTTAGNVGIGTTSPTARLEVLGTASISNAFSVDASNIVNIIGGNLSLAANNYLNVSTTLNVRDSNNAYASILSMTGTLATFAGGGTFGGTVTVNSSDTSATLQLTNTSEFAQGIGGYIQLGGRYDASATAYDFASIKGIKENATGGNYSGALTFSTRRNGVPSSERLRIDSTGKMGLGTVSPKSFFSIVDTSPGSVSSGSFAIRSSNTIASVASLSATSLTTGTVLFMTVPSSASAPAADYLVVRDTAGQVYASLGAGGELTLRRNIFSHGATSNCTGANAPTQGCIDYAESFPTTDPTLTAGELVSVDPANPSHIVRANSLAPLGIVSTAPAALIDGNAFKSGAAAIPSPGTVPIALAGRVPVRISTENGPIFPGDRLSLSPTIPGTAVKAVTSGMTIGIALEPSADSSPTILVFVNLSYWAPDLLSLLGPSASSSAQSVSTDDSSPIARLVRAVLGYIADTFGFIVEKGRIQSDKLCAGTTCVDEQQLQQLLLLRPADSEPPLIVPIEPAVASDSLSVPILPEDPLPVVEASSSATP